MNHNLKYNYLTLDFEAYNKILQNKKVIKLNNRNTIIFPEFIDKIVYIPNGNTTKKIKITENMIGTKFGQFAFTRKFCKHKKNNLLNNQK